MSKKLKHLVIGLSLCLVVGLGIFAYRSGLFEPAPSEQHIREAIVAHIMATTPLVYRNPATERQIYSEFFARHLKILKVGGYDRARRSWVVSGKVNAGFGVQALRGGYAEFLSLVVVMSKLDQPRDYIVCQDADGKLRVEPEAAGASQKQPEPDEPPPVGSEASARAPMTGLCDAVKEADLPKIRDLLDKGADTGEKDSEGMTPLCLAAVAGDVAAVELLVAKKTEVATGCKDGFTALELAARKGHKDAVDRLLEKGADVNARDRFGASSLWLAASAGHLEAVKALIAKGAQLSITDNRGFTPLHEAAGGGHSKVVAFLLSKGADIDARARDRQGWTPLHYAVAKGSRETTALLLARGADSTAKGKDGYTPVDVAQKLGRRELLPLLSRRSGKPE